MTKRMKSYLLFGILLLVIMVAASFVSETSFSLNNKVYAQSIKKNEVTISKKTAVLSTGESITLKIKGSNEKVQWSSSNKKIATVTGKGKVKAIKEGSATITANVNNKKYQCKIYVTNVMVIQNMYIDNHTKAIYYNKAWGYDKKDIQVVVEDPSILTVDNLNILPLKLGSTRIWIKRPDNLIEGYNYVIHNTLNNAAKTGDYSGLQENQVKVARTLNTVTKNILKEDKDDVYKVKEVFDWICNHVEYDYPTYDYYLKMISKKEYQKHMDTFAYPQFDAYSLHGALLNQLAVCNGYADLFDIFMDILGIESQTISTAEHGWNIVKLEDGWYHVDTTWGDNDYKDTFDYEYLLFSDSTAANMESHRGASLKKGEKFGSKYLECFAANNNLIKTGDSIDFSILYADIDQNEEMRELFSNKDYFLENYDITEIEQRRMIVTSSNDTVIKVEGTTIIAVGKGTATVTVEILDEVVNDMFGKEVYSLEKNISYIVH